MVSARSTRAEAATAARADRRRFASSKLANRLAVALTSRRIRRSSQASIEECAPSRVSSAAMASPSRTSSRSAPRTSLALAPMPIRRAAPTSARAASGPGQVTSSEALRPGSVSDPWARNAPRHAASASLTEPATICGGNPRTGRPRWSIRPVCRASESPPATTRTTYLVPLRSPEAASTCTSATCPYSSPISLRSRRATAPVSSSASTITRPATMCSPPANRSSAETSALRAEILLTATRLSSSFTVAVIAIPGTPCPSLRCPSLRCQSLLCQSLLCQSLLCQSMTCPSLPCPLLPCPLLPGPLLRRLPVLRRLPQGWHPMPVDCLFGHCLFGHCLFGHCLFGHCLFGHCLFEDCLFEAHMFRDHGVPDFIVRDHPFQHSGQGHRQLARVVTCGAGNGDVVQIQLRPQPGSGRRQSLRQRD